MLCRPNIGFLQQRLGYYMTMTFCGCPGQCAGVEVAVKGIMEEVAAKEAAERVPHVATFSAVRMRFVDDLLLQVLAQLQGSAPANGAGPAPCQVTMCTRMHHDRAPASWWLSFRPCPLHACAWPDPETERGLAVGG
jgi:hypothetical protein